MSCRAAVQRRHEPRRAQPVTVEKNKTGGWRWILYPAAAFSLLAALIHLLLTPEYFEEWWAYGAFFLTAAVVQGAYGVALTRRPGQPLLLAGVGGNLALVAVYLVTRTVGIPFIGPRAGEVEKIGVLDLGATASEVAVVLALGVVLVLDIPPQKRILVLMITAIAIVSLGHVVHLLLR